MTSIFSFSDSTPTCLHVDMVHLLFLLPPVVLGLPKTQGQGIPRPHVTQVTKATTWIQNIKIINQVYPEYEKLEDRTLEGIPSIWC